MQGFFDGKNKKYVIKDMKPRCPCLNYLWNDRTVRQCDQFGRSAGCHIYTDSDDVLYAGKNCICIHASTDGEKKIKLPKSCSLHELYEKRYYSHDSSEGVFNMECGETLTFEIR